MNEENEINFEGMSIEEVATLLVEHPEMADRIFDSGVNLKELYEYIERKRIPDASISTKEELINNEALGEAMKSIVNHIQENLGYENFDDYEDVVVADEQLDFIIDKIDSQIENGSSPHELRELCAKYGYTLDEFYSPEILKDRYLYYGFDFDIESGALTPVSKEMDEDMTSENNEDK